MLGGIGICGRPFCCSQFLEDFQPVSTKMAKVQSMSLNPAKISGACGRLMCCLRYEQAAYEDLVKNVPKVGTFVETPAGYGVVTSVNLLRSTLKVKIDGEGEDVFKSYQASEIAVIPGGRPKPGEPIPSLLKDRPKPKKATEEQEEDPWALPPLFADDAFSDEKQAEKAADPAKKKRPRRRSRGNGGKKPAEGQKQPEQAKPADTEKSKSGTQQGKKSSRRGGQKKPSGEKQQTKQNAPQQEKSQKPAAKKPEDGQKTASGEQKASGGSSRRRHRGGRGRNKPKTPGAEHSAPPAE